MKRDLPYKDTYRKWDIVITKESSGLFLYHGINKKYNVGDYETYSDMCIGDVEYRLKLDHFMKTWPGGFTCHDGVHMWNPITGKLENGYNPPKGYKFEWED